MLRSRRGGPRAHRPSRVCPKHPPPGGCATRPTTRQWLTPRSREGEPDEWLVLVKRTRRRPGHPAAEPKERSDEPVLEGAVRSHPRRPGAASPCRPDRGPLPASALNNPRPAVTRWVDNGSPAPAGPPACSRAAFNTIQAAVDASSAGDVVRVCPGTYVENVVVLTDGLAVVSTGGSGVTTVQAPATSSSATWPRSATTTCSTSERTT